MQRGGWPEGLTSDQLMCPTPHGLQPPADPSLQPVPVSSTDRQLIPHGRPTSGLALGPTSPWAANHPLHMAFSCALPEAGHRRPGPIPNPVGSEAPPRMAFLFSFSFKNLFAVPALKLHFHGTAVLCKLPWVKLAWYHSTMKVKLVWRHGRE